MNKAFSLLPNLASVRLARRLQRNWAGNKVKPPDRIARESLCEPNVFAGIRYYPNHFGDLGPLMSLAYLLNGSMALGFAGAALKDPQSF